MSQQGDIFLTDTPDHGDICTNNGFIGMTTGLETALYLSLFGGNLEDDGRKQQDQTWWGNIALDDDDMNMVSETQFILKNTEPNSGSLKKIEDAVQRDLEWLLRKNLASSIEAVANIPDLNKIHIEINIIADGISIKFQFVENWIINL